MRGFLPIFKRELFAFFVTPLAWVVTTAFLVAQGGHFYFLLAHHATLPAGSGAPGPVESFFGGTVIIYLPLLIICPLLTMRLFAEERRSGTIEPLLTAPVSSAGVVLGKYAAVLVAYVAMWLPTVAYFVSIDEGDSVDWRVVGSGYLAVLAIGAGYLAIGTMTSALSKSQLSAAVLSAMTLVGLFTLGVGEFIFEQGPLRDLCGYVSAWSQMNDFSRGVVDSRRLLFDATAVALPLFITVRAVDAWRLE